MLYNDDSNDEYNNDNDDYDDYNHDHDDNDKKVL